MATEWKSQQSAGDYRLQFQTDDKEKYKLVEKAAQMAVDGKHIADVVEVKHGTWLRETVKGVGYAKCSACGGTMSIFCYGHDYCPRCGARMDGERKE